jgi:uncharacterized protein YcnI
MSALKDVQRSLNVIRKLSAEENAHVQQQILELMLQASISQLKSTGEEPQSKDKAPSKPTTLKIPKPAKFAEPKPAPSWASRRSKLRAIESQAPNS